MTEKEFLESFIEHAEAMGYLSDQDIEKFIDSFLEYFHQTYFEVEFVKKEEEPLTFKGVPIKFDDVVKEEMDKLKPTITDILNKNIK